MGNSQVLVDTNFIINCVRNKIDFFDEIRSIGLKVILPQEIIKELEKIANSKKKLHFRRDAEIALKLIKMNKHEEINLERKNVDLGIIHFANKNKGTIVATFDKELSQKLNGNKMIVRNKKNLEII